MKAVETAKAQRAQILGQDADEDDSEASSDEAEDENKVETDATMQFEGGTSSVVVVTEAIGGPVNEAEDEAAKKKADWEVRKAKEDKEAARAIKAERMKPKNYLKKQKHAGIRHRGKTQGKRAKKKK